MTDLTLALLIFLFPLAWSPGPGNMFFAANGARFGLVATLPANAGYHLATWLVTLAIGLGFAEMTRRAGFGSGVLLLLLNPKAHVIIVLMFSQFAGDEGSFRRVLWITTLFTLNNLCAFLAWTLAGDRIGRRLRQGTVARKVNRGFAAVLAAVALWMACAG